ncbi:uncharacterized protein LOC136026662 [Artemia franciscana]|uniref:Uncharacterized protein n=1 Tax=Artemia franciscana TaxID=6661 RepID=A0AA88HP53_ARTSF|nr:hypothetical protein QYM36_012005 [Artemia franciscana]
MANTMVKNISLLVLLLLVTGRIEGRNNRQQLVDGYPEPQDIDGTSDLLRQLTQVDNEIELEDSTAFEDRDSDTDVDPKPTKYHFFPHNQHIYLLPECAAQQVCNAVYSRLNYSQPLCACPDRFNSPCSASTNINDQHTIELGLGKIPKAKTLAKTCENVSQIRPCRSPQDWALLALQNVKTGKAQYLAICRCEGKSYFEGPMSHDQPAYAHVPGIRVYGMMCVTGGRRAVLKRKLRPRQKRLADLHLAQLGLPEIPEMELQRLVKSLE